jgi:lysozyme
MRTNNEGLELIMQFEGCKLDAYYDSVAIPTIGYGHTGPDVWIGLTIDLQRARNLLYNDVVEFESQVSLLLTKTINDNQFSALVSFAYNLGANTLKHSTLLKYVNENLFKEAAEEFEKWVKAGGQELPGLIKRRKAERALFEKAVA